MNVDNLRIAMAAACLSIGLVSSVRAEVPVVVEWMDRYTAQTYAAFDCGRAVAVDSAGNALVALATEVKDPETGYSLGLEIETIKYDPLGNRVWVRHFAGTNYIDDQPYAIAVDSQDNAIVVGRGYLGGDFVTLKYDPAGNLLWERRYKGVGFTDEARAVCVDGSDNVLVAGTSATKSDFNSYGDYAVVKYDADGNELWAARYGSAGNGSDVLRGLAVDNEGNVFLTGDSKGGITTLKYDPSGGFLWERSFAGASAGSVAADAQGNVAVVGSVLTATHGYDFLILQYNPAGDRLWRRTYDGASHLLDKASLVRIDQTGAITVGGYSEVAVYSGDFTTLRYSPTGTLRWARRYDNFGSDDHPTAMGVDARGNVYVTGFSQTSTQWHNFLTIMFSSSGQLQWATTYSGTGGNTGDIALGIAVDADESAYVTGWSTGETSGDDCVTMKLTSLGVRSLTLAPLPHTGGTHLEGAVELNGLAPVGGVTVLLSSGSPDLATVPATVLVPEGTATATFGVTTAAVGEPTAVRISARLGIKASSIRLVVRPPSLLSLTLDPAEVVGGNPSTGTVTLTGPAPAGGLAVLLASDRPKAVVPETVIVPEGSTTTTFEVQSKPVLLDQTAKIKANLGAVSRIAYLRITR